MRKFIVPSVLALTLAFTANAFAGGGRCCAGGAKTAGAKSSCSMGKTASLPEGLKVDTFRLPSGALAVFYTSEKPELVAALREKAAAGADNFSCGICREMAQTKDCKVELVPFANGVIAFVTANEPAKLDAFEKQYAALTTAQTPVPGQ